jgi:DNA-binding FrmR family transcriptional regulator
MINPHPNFKHYFDSKQIKFENFFLFWNKKDLTLIKNSLLENTLKDMQLTLLDHSNLLQKSSYKKPYDFTDLKKAFVYMNSQNFKITIKDQTYHALIPFIDMYEIYPSTNVDWSSSLQSLNDTVKLFAIENIKKGDPIITNYGEMDNANLLINFGFTIGNNTFPIESEFFLFNWEEQEYPIALKQNSTKDIIETVARIKAENLLSNKVKRNKADVKSIKNPMEDLRIFQEILKQLAQYSNKKRLESLAMNLIDNPSAANILRALQAEDILIDENMMFVAEIIKILSCKTDDVDIKLRQRPIYKENKAYFDAILGVAKGSKGKKIEGESSNMHVVFEFNNRL